MQLHILFKYKRQLKESTSERVVFPDQGLANYWRSEVEKLKAVQVYNAYAGEWTRRLIKDI